MIKEIQYTNIRRVLDNIMEHPLLRDVTLEQAVRYTVRFISLHGYPKLFQDKMERVEIHDFRGVLPCDLVSIIQVKDLQAGVCMRAMSDNFARGMEGKRGERHWQDRRNGHHGQSRPQERKAGEMMKEGMEKPLHKFNTVSEAYIPHAPRMMEEPAFKTQGRVIYVTFPEGCVEIAYKSIPVDEDGFPLLIDNENYLAALEAFIKVQVFTIKFDTGKINANVLQNAQQDYAWRAGELQDEFTVPSVSEAESLSRFGNTLIVNMREFDNGFKHLGDREYLRRH